MLRLKTTYKYHYDSNNLEVVGSNVRIMLDMQGDVHVMVNRVSNPAYTSRVRPWEGFGSYSAFISYTDT